MALMKDIISASCREKLVSLIERGDIVRMTLTPKEGVRPKNEGEVSRDKYFVVLGKSEDEKLIGFVLINTEINNNISCELRELHYPLSSNRYPFLKKTRYVYCGELKTITLSDFASRYSCSTFGKIMDEDLQYISDALVTSPIMTKKQLRRFGLTA